MINKGDLGDQAYADKARTSKWSVLPDDLDGPISSRVVTLGHAEWEPGGAAHNSCCIDIAPDTTVGC